MKYGCLLSLAFFSSVVCANESIANNICNAYKNDHDKKECFKELSDEAQKEKQRDKRADVTIKADNSLSNPEIAHAFTIMNMAFVGVHSPKSIKSLLDKTMILYNTPLTLENYNSCASVLVTMRKDSGFTEMSIMNYMINMHSQSLNLNFPTAAAYASTLMGG